MPLDLIRGQDALINCAGHVADGETFVGLVDRLVTAVDSLPGGAARLLVPGGRWRSSTSTRPAGAASTCPR